MRSASVTHKGSRAAFKPTVATRPARGAQSQRCKGGPNCAHPSNKSNTSSTRFGACARQFVPFCHAPNTTQINMTIQKARPMFMIPPRVARKAWRTPLPDAFESPLPVPASALLEPLPARSTAVSAQAARLPRRWPLKSGLGSWCLS